MNKGCVTSFNCFSLFYCVVPWFYQVLLGVTKFEWVLIETDGVLLSFIGFYGLITGCIGLYIVLSLVSYRVLPSFIGFLRFFPTELVFSLFK